MELLEIQKLPTAENSAIHLHPSDNVAIARVPLAPGQTLHIEGNEFVAKTAVPAGHKLALMRIEPGEYIYRYGQRIGRAARLIEPGEHIHTQNVAYEEIEFQYDFPESERAMPAPPANMPTFMGYRREDGRVGTRNYIAVVAASNCAAYTSELIAQSFLGETLPSNIDGVMAFPHGEGCGMSPGADAVQLRRTLSGVLAHPNVAAAVILGLGCEVNQIDHYLGPNAPRGSRLVGLTLQGSGGTQGAKLAARREIKLLLEQCAEEKRTESPASKIVLGLNCGGSDSFSGITANPALGVASDMLAALGGSPVLAETTEIFGAEHLLVRRARNREVAEKLLGFVRGYKKYLNQFGGSFDDNPSPGNKEGGLTNILEKSLGAVAKAGSSMLTDAVDYAERITVPGFNFMNTPGYDPPSLAGLAAGGCNMIVFTTGRGSAIGFPTVPVIKVASNTFTYRRMTDNMDINAGTIADGDRTIQEVGREIFDMILRSASGERTKAEILGHHEFVPWRIGPVM
ncbi:MAG TPA: altronate dehydratase family protein [Bryobacteraceae bacterium]|nr:altronate dehydratase family protein [Bryobacteraceae bacterium]